MNRNTNSRFAYNPEININRSKMTIPHSVKTTFDVGQIIPFYKMEVLPGDTFSVSTSKIVRMQTLLTPMMSNLFLDTYFFFVPNRLVWTHWKEFMGENTSSYWAPQVEYTIPQIIIDKDHPVTAKSNADYLGLPVGQVTADGAQVSVSALPFRALGLIYNEWFRSENLIAPDNVYLGDNSEYLDPSSAGYLGTPYIAAKYFDQFTGGLPAPQKGPSVLAPISTDYADVVTGPDHLDHLTLPGTVNSMHMAKTSDASWIESNHYLGSLWSSSGYDATVALNSGFQNSDVLSGISPANLYTDFGTVGIDINSLRMSFQIQKLLEKDARGGSRYIELIRSHFNTVSPDYRLQRPEYLGGNRIPININQVIQQSETSASSPMGNTAGMSVTSDVHADFTKSFTEHGYIIGVMVARYDHTYQNGIERDWSRKTRLDYYFPVLANIGEQAIKNKEIFSDGTSNDDEVFAYQEAWYEYRYKPDLVTAEMRSNYATSLDVWHLADDYSQLPALSQAWLEEDKTNVDRVLAVTSAVSNQLFGDIYVKATATRPMPLYSIPGLIDHH
jgi:hypothetical protein